MEGIDTFQAYLKNLHRQTGILTEAAVSLSKSFEAEADRLTCEDEAQRLKAIHAAIMEELDKARRLEDASHNSSIKADLTLSLTGLAARVVMAATTKNQPARNFVNQVFDADADKTRPYGTVIVCVGRRGLPEDVRVVSISKLARESNRSESETIQKLRKGGYLLYSQEMFSRLIEKLVIDVREGRLHLPVSSGKLSEIRHQTG